MLECASDVQPNLFYLSDKRPHSHVALGSVPVEDGSGPEALQAPKPPESLSHVPRNKNGFSFVFFVFVSLPLIPLKKLSVVSLR